MNKKAVSISMNTIVIAIIALIVLVVIIAIFTGAMDDIANKFRRSTDEAGKKSDSAIEQLNFFDCEEGQTKCTGKDLKKCIDGKWETEEEDSSDCE